jgi:hypothetical protein
LVNAFKTDSQQAYAALKQQENIITLKRSMPINYWKQVNCLWRKLKQAKLKRIKAALNVQAKIKP